MTDQEKFEKLIDICNEKMATLGLAGNEAYENRLKDELKEVNAQNLSDYFLDFIDKNAKLENENNLLIPYLLGVVNSVDISQEPKCDYGEFPDIDVDYLPSIRNYLKEQYARSQFGDDYVCNIATYTTFGLRSALIDMAKVFDLDRKEILALTTRLGIKDDEGEILTWDKAIELYDDLRKYMEEHPDMADAARRILHRNRNMGMHASGLIISRVPIDEFVPLVRIKDGAGACSAWVEGLHGTDLGAVGLVKFDFLSLEGNMKIAQSTHLVSELDGYAGANNIKECCKALDVADKMIGKVAALPGKSNWTDTSYLDDEKAIEMADKGDLKMIFQYDGSDGIRRLAKQGGITSFDDLVAYTALYRPGPMKLGYHDIYCTRKRGNEKYEIHPLLEDFMSFTYGVLTYQEQIMRMLNVVGKIPLKDCEAVRKAISKKKVDKFQKYKDMFVANGQTTLGWTVEELEHVWKQIEAFAGYGFNLCVSGNTKVNVKGGKQIPIKNIKIGTLVECFDRQNRLTYKKVTALHDNGVMKVTRMKTKTGRGIVATGEHKFLTIKGWKCLKDLNPGDRIAIPRKLYAGQETYDKHKILAAAFLLTESNCCHPSSLYFYNTNEDLLSAFESSALKFPNTSTRREEKNSCPCVVANTGIPNGSKGKSGIYEWANSVGITGTKATSKTLPDFVWNLNNELLAEFLGALWSCDGHLGKEKWTQIFYATSSKILADDLVSIHLRLGICLTKHKKKFKYRGEEKIGYTLTVTGGQSKNNFLSLVAPYCIGKQSEVSWLRNNCKTNLDFVDTMPTEIIDIINESCIGYSKKEIAKKSNIAERLLYKDKTKKGLRRSTLTKIAESVESMTLLNMATSDVYWDEIKSISQAGEENVYDITVEDHHNYIANCIVSHNSHAVAYTYISARMLYLKAHYPLAFYTSVIDCTKAAGPKDYAKIKDYKMEAMKHGIKVNRVDVNKAKFEVSAQEGQIYWGFSKIKGLGDDAALRMQQMQPYTDYEDFLTRFGTDAKANQAVIALQLFPGNQKKMYYFYQEFKALEKKRTDRMKRHNDAIERHKNNLSEIIGYEFEYPLTKEYFDKLRSEIDDSKHKSLDSLWKKVKKTRDTYDKNQSEKPPSFDTFEIDESSDPIPEDYLLLLENIEAADEEYYGFVWDHPLEKAKHYNHKTFENFDAENNEVGPIDVMVRQVKQMKGPKATYYSVEVEDATGQTRRVTTWTDDFKRFEHLLTKGNCVRMTVKAPTQGFSNFTLYSPGNRWQKPSKTNDLRVFPLN